MANPALPTGPASEKLGYGIYDDAGAAEAALTRVVNASVVATATQSGAMAVASMVLHDAADVAAEGPIKVGGYASTAAPAAVAAADRVAAWFTLNGAQVVAQVAHTVGGATPYSALSTAAVL